MPPNLAGKSRHGQDAWWYVENLIAGIDATPTQKYLLTLVHRHTNRKTGRAWAGQNKLAAEMNADVRTVQRAFRWAKKAGFVHIERIRKTKRPTEQNNHYWLNVEALKANQHPTPVSADRASEHPTPLSCDLSEHTTPVSQNTRHFKHGTPDTSVGEGFEVAGNEDSGYETSRALHSARRKTAAPQSGLATGRQIAPRDPELMERIVDYIERRRQEPHPYAQSRKIAPWSVVNYAKQHGAVNHEHAVEVANAAIALFPAHIFGARWL